MNRTGCPSASVRRGLLLLACLGVADLALPLPSDPRSELFAIHIKWGNGFLEFPYGFLDPETLDLRQPSTWFYAGAGVLSVVSAVDPAGGRFFLIGSDRSLIVVDGRDAHALDLPLLGFSEFWEVFCLEYESTTRTLLGIAALQDNTWRGRLVAIDPDTGGITPRGETVVPLASQAVSAVDWEGNRFFVPGYEAGEIRLSVLDLRTGALLESPRVHIESQKLRSLEWDPLAANLLCIFTKDFNSSSLARIDPETGEVRRMGDLEGPRVSVFGASTLDAAGRRLYFLADSRVWVADPGTARIIDSSPGFEPAGLFAIHHVPLSEDAASPFRRGDANSDGIVNLGDPIWLLNWLFTGGPPPPCLKAGDTNDDGRLALDDALGLLRYRFQGGSPPASPFPSCGPDPTPDALDCGTSAGC